MTILKKYRYILAMAMQRHTKYLATDLCVFVCNFKFGCKF